VPEKPAAPPPPPAFEPGEGRAPAVCRSAGGVQPLSAIAAAIAAPTSRRVFVIVTAPFRTSSRGVRSFNRGPGSFRRLV
jgi:hypothetical protein